jgi:hypothetical protein
VVNTVRFLRRKRKSGVFLLEKVKKLRPDIEKDNIVTLFAFDLDPEMPGKRVDGIILADREYLSVFIDGNETMRIRIEDISEIKTVAGVGTVLAHYTLKADNSTHLLCIGRMSCSKKMTEGVKLISRIIEHGVEYFDRIRSHMKESGGLNADGDSARCPKCGRPLPRGSEKCPRCVSKLATLKRLWEIVKPYKWFIFISVALFFAVSGLNLVIPELNRILVDDYIDAGKAEILGYVSVVLLMLLSQIVLRGLGVLRSHALIQASNSMIVDLRNMLFEKIQRLSIERISKRTAPPPTKGST